jgi:hypothetical protein
MKESLRGAGSSFPGGLSGGLVGLRRNPGAVVEFLFEMEAYGGDGLATLRRRSSEPRDGAAYPVSMVTTPCRYGECALVVDMPDHGAPRE